MATGALVAAVVSLVRCVPPPPMGYIAPGPQTPGRVIVGLQGGAGVGAVSGVSGGGALQVEVFGSHQTSMAMTAVVGGGGFAEVDFLDSGIESRLRVYGQIRLGVRHRLGNGFFLGGGASGHVRWVKEVWTDPEDNGYSTPGMSGGFSLDFEWGYGKRWRRVGLSFGQRLHWDGLALVVFQLYNELTLAWFPKGDRFAITFHVGLGLTLPYLPWGSAGVGFVALM